ncbi:MAG: outer membrane lipid asymmetry maintenance protein MlaD [Methylococcales bacterium]|nr:outer membrane lipid asymmetry maintenance protein MlaD [Methylococcales bacterium]
MGNTVKQDTLVGLFVAIGIGSLFFMAMQISNFSGFSDEKSYTISAAFENSGGLKVKSPVVVGGVRVGRVIAITLDQKKFQSVVKMKIEAQYNQLPEDTTASIFTAGLLGEQYVSLEPGGMDDLLSDNSMIEITQSALVLEEIIGQFLFKDKDADSAKKE